MSALYVCMLVSMYVCMYVCMCVCVCYNIIIRTPCLPTLLDPRHTHSAQVARAPGHGGGPANTKGHIKMMQE